MVNKARSLCGLSWADGHSSGRTVVLPTPVSSLLNVFTPGIFSANFLLLLGSAGRKIDKQGNNADLTLGKIPQLLHRCFMQFAQVKQQRQRQAPQRDTPHTPQPCRRCIPPGRPVWLLAPVWLVAQFAERDRAPTTRPSGRGVKPQRERREGYSRT